MNEPNFEQAFNELRAWCRARDFAGYDPFDALNSRLFQSTPFGRSPAARLVWTQALKRSPLNLRRFALVPPQKNSKGLALFALAALANFRRVKTRDAEMDARALLDELWRARIQGYRGSAWGYNFAWQSRNFFAPQGTPMIVPTAFATRAFIEAHQAFAAADYLEIARSSCDFILDDLKRTFETEEEVCFSYSPLDNTQIFNASLLAAETLASVGTLSGEPAFCDLALRAARYVVRRQNEDGSWGYGAERGQLWVDNFHTAYVFLSLARIARSCSHTDDEIKQALQSGYAFWKERFFLADGWPKYYHDSLYPADAHAAATAVITLLELREVDNSAPLLAEKIAAWTISNLRDARGFFYYQRRRFYTVHTPYMRWTQSWMLYALARLLEEK
ncbi:MAG TPA: hypothetical protein VGO56_07815 [Pyrinomonadaceae bacterium]|jgi:hypothetical protein|nr:hypothetical protein [Pyrinomonadaceae bacterium]